MSTYVSRENQETFGARRNYSTGPNTPGYALRNYASNIYEYNRVLDEINQIRR